MSKKHAYHSIRALLAESFITQKVGMSIDAQERLYSMLRTYVAY